MQVDSTQYSAKDKTLLSSTTVLGRFPGYIALSDKLGARRFDVGPAAWSAMGPNTAWAANRYFLDAMIYAGDSFVLSVNPRLVRPGRWLFRELLHLRTSRVRIPVAPAWTN